MAKLGMFQSTPEEYEKAKNRKVICPVTGIAAEYKPVDDESYIQNPYPFLKRAREEEAVFYSPEFDVWVVTKYEDIVKIFRDPHTFSAANARHPVTPLCPAAIAKRNEYNITTEPSLVDEDPETHIKHRRIFGDAFTPKRVNELEPRVREIVTRYIDRFIDKGKADIVADLMYEVPALAIFIFLGADDADAVLVKELAGPRAVVNWGRPTEEEQVSMMESVGKHWQFTVDLVDKALENPGDNYLGDLAHIYHDDPSKFTVNYLYNVMFLMQFAGHETTTMSMSSGIRLLLENRDQWQALCDDPSLIPNAVEEILRYEGSIFNWRRITTKETEVRGVTIPEDASILLVTGSGSHDSEQFPDGETFDIRRPNAKKQLALGHGAHFCMGAPLARLEMRIVLEELTKRIPHMRLIEQRFEYTPTLTFRGPKQVLVEWDV